MPNPVLTVAWFSYFPVEWLPDVPASVQALPRCHPATWQQVLLGELEKNPAVKLHIFALRKQFDQDLHFERRGVSFHLLKTRGGLRASSLFWLDTFLLRRVLRQIQPDLVHAWGTENGAALVASRLPYPYLVTMQGLMAWLADTVPVSRYERLMAFLEKRSLRRGSIVSAESNFAVQYLHDHYPRLEVRQIEHAPKPVFHQVPRRPQLSPLRFIFVGGLSHLKGADLLLGALDRLQGEFPFGLTVVSGPGGHQLSNLQASVSPELWARIQFQSNLTSEELAAQFATATMMIYPTRADNSPNVVKEAVVAGLPVVASAVGGIPDYVFPGQNGFLFPAGDVAGCAQAIQTACRHPLFARGLVESAALERVRAALSPARMADNFLAAYRRTLELRSQRG